MSIERELLKKALDFMLDAGANLNPLFKEINDNLLAQPEQEPVAWGYKKRVTYKPEGSEEEEIIPLYTAPPKREPLSDKDIGKGFLLTDVWHRYECFIAGVKWAERQHGIGGGE